MKHCEICQENDIQVVRRLRIINARLDIRNAAVSVLGLPSINELAPGFGEESEERASLREDSAAQAEVDDTSSR